jgi:hypothetical protein
MTHRVPQLNGLLGPAYHFSEWHPADELKEALERNEDR